MAKLEIELSEFDALRDAKNKAENDLKELKQSHKEEISDLKNTIKDIEKRSRVIVKHKDRYFYRTAFDRETIKSLKNNLKFDIQYGRLNIGRILNDQYLNGFDKVSTIVDIIVEKINKCNFIEVSDEIEELFSENGEPDQYIGFEDIKLEVEKELKDQYINNQKKLQENLEQQIKKYEEKYELLEADVHSQYNSQIRILEDKLNNSQEDANKLKETHKEEVDKLNEDIDKLKEELKEAQKTQEEKILEAEEKLKEAQEVLKKLTNNPRKKWYQFWK